MASSREKTMGKEIVSRLERFTKKLDGINKLSEITEVLTVRTVKLNLHPKAFSSDEIKAIRNSLKVSQPVLAEFLGVAPATLRDWEQGISEPSGPACRLLEEMNRDLVTWATRIRELASPVTNS